MKIYNLTEKSKIYTSNVYYILGEWNTLDDVNTLIDVGSDMAVIDAIEEINAGLGKKKIDQVIITHNHSDHVAILHRIIELYHPKVYAFDVNLKGVDSNLKDGDKLRIGELEFEVIHITVHSSDSICLYCEKAGLLFTGDTTFPIEIENINMEIENAHPLSRLSNKQILKIYPGHGGMQDNGNQKFRVLRSHQTTEIGYNERNII